MIAWAAGLGLGGFWLWRQRVVFRVRGALSLREGQSAARLDLWWHWGSWFRDHVQILGGDTDANSARRRDFWPELLRKVCAAPPDSFLRRCLRQARLTLDWRTDLGLGTPWAGGMGSGALWALKGYLLGRLSNFFTCEQLQLQIGPRWDGFGLDTEFDGIILIKLVHIIAMIGAVLALMIRR